MSLPGLHPVDSANERIKIAARIADLQRQIDALARAGSPGTGTVVSGPVGPAGGVLSGSYPNPGFAEDMATQAELEAQVDALTALLNRPAGGDLTGTYPNPQVAKLTEPSIKIDGDTRLAWQSSLSSYDNMVLGVSGLGSYWKLDETGTAPRTFVDAMGVVNFVDQGNGSTIPYYTYGQTPLVSGSTYSIYNPNQAFAAASQAFYQFASFAPFSIELWVKPTTQWGRNQLMSNGRWDSYFKGWELSMEGPYTTSGYFFFGRYNTAAQYTRVSSATYTVGNTYHVVATFDGSTMSIYVNGVLDGTAPGTYGVTGGDQSFDLGRQLVDTYHMTPHYMDSPAVYNRALTPTEVATHYAIGTASTPTTTYLESYGRVGFTESFATNPLANYSKLTNQPYANNDATWDTAYNPDSIQGGGGSPGGLSWYKRNDSNAIASADCDWVIEGSTDYDTNYLVQAVLYDPQTTWHLRAGHEYYIYSGNRNMVTVAYDNTGSQVLSDATLLNGYTPPPAGDHYWTRLTKTGNVVRTRLYLTNPATGGSPVADTSTTLTGTVATNLGAGRILRPGFLLGGSDRIFSMGEATFGGASSRTARIALTSAGGEITDRAVMYQDGTTELLPRDGAITTAKLADDSVTSAKIAADAVGSSEIATDAVGSAEIAAGAVGSSELATDAVTQVKVANAAIGAAELATTGTPDGTKFLRDDMAWATPAGGGGTAGALADMPVTMLTHSANQSINNTTSTTLGWDTEIRDDLGLHAAGANSIVIPSGQAGRYLVTIHGEMASTGSITELTLLKNGTGIAVDGSPSMSGDNVTLRIAHVLDLVAGDTLTTQIWHNTGGARNWTNSRGPGFEVTKLVSGGSGTAGYVSAYKSANDGTNLVLGTPRQVVFDTEVSDTNNWYDNSTGRFTPPSGLYCINAHVYSYPMTSGATEVVQLYKNGALHKVLAGNAGGSYSDYNMPGGAAVVAANGTDYFEIYHTVVGSLGANQRVQGNAEYTYFQAYSLVADTPESMHLVGGSGEPAFANSYVNYAGGFDPVGFYKDRGRVYLQGLYDNASPPALGTTIFTLPVGYRPSLPIRHPINANNAFGVVNIATTGAVSVVVGSTGFGGLEGVSFRL